MPYRSRILEISATLKPRVIAAMRVGAETVAEEAKARVPVATGRLHEAIHTEVEGDGVYVIAGDEKVFYGHLVEHGTTRVPARPFLVPALEARKETILASVQAVLKSL